MDFTLRFHSSIDTIINRNQIPKASFARYLGMHPDSRLIWREHLSSNQKCSTFYRKNSFGSSGQDLNSPSIIRGEFTTQFSSQLEVIELKSGGQPPSQISMKLKSFRTTSSDSSPELYGLLKTNSFTLTSILNQSASLYTIARTATLSDFIATRMLRHQYFQTTREIYVCCVSNISSIF